MNASFYNTVRTGWIFRRGGHVVYLVRNENTALGDCMCTKTNTPQLTLDDRYYVRAVMVVVVVAVIA